ncbi:50S ribosomal protein L32 [Candidatus Azambacteria bacterium]|nr:50S ribosomal protein L32 [Candidatus Azambacteria bacterium]
MANPKSRHNRSRTNRRRTHHALKAVALASCPKCKSLVLPHVACANCGSYAGREVVDVMAKLDKKKKKSEKHDHKKDEK